MLSNKFTITFFTYILLALTLVEATSHSTGALSRREHGNLKRLVKKRSPFPQTDTVPPKDKAKDKTKDQNLGSDDIFDDLGPVVGAGANPDVSSSSSANTTVSSTSIFSSASASASQSSSTSGSSSLSASSASVSLSSSSSTSTSQSTPTTSSSSTQTTNTPPPQNTPPPKSTVTKLSTATLPEQTTTNNAKVAGAATKSKTVVLTTLIVVASCVGGIAILWTIFRKWKLGSSKEFDQRLQPIDWQPTSHDDDGVIPSHRRHSAASSLRRNYGAASDTASEYRQGSLQPIPDHDFTAGSNLAPVGGYADLSRGPSPQPQMMERGPNMSGPGYGNGLPLHHQGYGSQDAYHGGRY